jgi:hypothetical protein
MPMSGSLKVDSGISVPASDKPLHAQYSERIPMKKLITVFAVCLSLSLPSFGAEHLVSRSAKAAGKDTYKVTKYSVKKTGKVLKSVL